MEALLEGKQLVLEMCAHDAVNRSKRLVHQQYRRVCRKSTGDSDPLALPAGELRRIPIEHVGVECNEVRQFVDPLVDPRPVPVE